MAIEKVINIVANTQKAVKDVGNLFDKLVEAEKEQQALNESAEGMEKAYKDSSKEATKAVDKIGDSAKRQTSVMKGLGTAVNAVGASLKALGIGLIIALVAKFTQALSENKTVVDTVSAVSNALSIIFNELFTAVGRIYDKIVEATGGFDALGKVVSSLIKLAFNQLKITILALEGGFTALKLAYEKVFGDEEGVKKAQANLEKIDKKIKEINKDNVKQAKTVIDNIGEAINEVTTAVTIAATEGVKAISEIDVARAYAQGKAMQEAKNNFELLALQQARLQLKYQNQAELLRQIRDDDRKGLTERIKANDELAIVLDKQFKAESATIKARISALQNEQNLLGVTQERTNEIYQLNTDLIDVEERLNGARSEQLTNTNALLREQADLQQTIIDATNERALNEIKFEAEQQDNALRRLELQKEAIELQKELDLAELERKRLLYAEDTQARVDAEQEFLNAKQETDQALIENQKATNLELLRTEKEFQDMELNAKQAFEDAKYSIANQTVSLIAGLAGKSKAIATTMLLIEKSLAISQVITNASRAIAQGQANLLAVPAFIGVAPNPAYIGQAIATAKGTAITKITAGLAIGNILAQTVGSLSKGANLGGDSSGGGGGGGQVPTAPSFNLVQGTGSNQIAESLQSQNRPIQAYVVASEVTTQQSLERNIISNSSL